MDLVTVRALLQPVVEEHGCDLYQLEWTGGILRLLCDRPDGADLDSLSRISTAAEARLDGADPIKGGYMLEVSSPGLERPLRRPDHWTRLLGGPDPWTVAVKTRPEVEGERRLTGPLESADEQGCVVAGRRLAYDQIESAHTVFVWGAQSKPKKSDAGRKKSAGAKQSADGAKKSDTKKSAGAKKSKKAVVSADTDHPSPETPRSAQA